MQIAIISDIHANHEALTVVLADIKRRSIKDIVCLGDIIGYGPNPRECLQDLMGCKAVLMGNHEEAVLYYGEDFNPKAREAIDWTRDQLNRPDCPKEENYDLWNFLGVMEQLITTDEAMFVHASPRDPTKEYVTPDDCKKDRAKLEDIFTKFDRICFIGHSHIAGVYTQELRYIDPKTIGNEYTIEDERKVLINTGAVGQPRDGDPRASYVTFDGRTVRVHRLEYDFKATMDKIYKEERLPNYLADRLAV
ncbi:MAG: metallophosphoesterase family protein, partial [Chloroflexi bacterium]|nr:metallophosphoesterase family protein [Chloroflexota bacterium]